MPSIYRDTAPYIRECDWFLYREFKFCCSTTRCHYLVELKPRDCIDIRAKPNANPPMTLPHCEYICISSETQIIRSSLSIRFWIENTHKSHGRFNVKYGMKSFGLKQEIPLRQQSESLCIRMINEVMNRRVHPIFPEQMQLFANNQEQAMLQGLSNLVVSLLSGHVKCISYGGFLEIRSPGPFSPTF